MSLLYQKHASRPLTLDNRVEPELYRDVFPYTHVSRIEFDDTFLVPRPADPMFITDTTFRDGQQARPPYTVKRRSPASTTCSTSSAARADSSRPRIFMYSPRIARLLKSAAPEATASPASPAGSAPTWTTSKIAHDMEFDEVGLLTSMSDYHIFLKLGKTREQAMNDYLKVVTKALEWGIVPRCHFEDVTRADIYGFCLPFARKLMELSHEASMPIKIRLCDTMGYGVPFPGAALPRSVQRIVRAFTDEAGVPGAWLEWHGHNDFHKVLVNGVTAWLYGCGGVNGTLMGFGERTGNAPLEALVIDYISLTGNDEAADPTVITEIAQYFEKELDYRIPDNYPFAGKDFNATSAGIHVDGLAKNEEIYNIFDTTKILNRSVPIIINDKAGRAGVAYWINQQFNLPPERQVSKKHPAVGQIHTRIMAAYEEGRNTSFSNKEIKNLVRRFMPELFDSEFDQMKRIAGELASNLVERLARDCQSTADSEALTAQLQHFVRDYSFIQYAYVTDVKGHSTAIAISDPGDQKGYKAFPIGFDYSNREWFLQPMRTGKLHITNVHQSQVTGQLIITVSTVITDANDEIIGVLGADIQLEEIIRRAESLEAEVPNSEEE